MWSGYDGDNKMNGYIINPAWFYWVNIANGIKIIISLLAVASLVASFLSTLISLDDTDTITSKKFEKMALKMFIVAIVCIIISLFIPSKETLIEMKIAEYVTLENAEWTVAAIKDLVDYIVRVL